MVDKGVIDEFAGLHEKFIQDSATMAEIQRGVLMGMRDIGVGCETEDTKIQFFKLKGEIEATLEEMKKMCDKIR